MKQIRYGEGLEPALRPFRPSPVLTIFVWLPVWLGAIWTAFSLLVQLGIAPALLSGFLLTTILFGATNLISGYLLERGSISQQYAGFRLYSSWYERNWRGFIILTPTTDHGYHPKSDGEMRTFVHPRTLKLPSMQGHYLWLSVGGWFPRSGGIRYAGLTEHSPSMRFKFSSLDVNILNVVLIQSNGSRATVSLYEAFRLAEENAAVLTSGLPRGPNTIEGVISNYFRQRDQQVVLDEVPAE